MKKYFNLGIDILTPVCYYKATQERQGEAKAPTKGSEGMDEMNSADVEILKFNNQLETIAKLIEAKATTAAEAAEIVRDCKLKA